MVRRVAGIVLVSALAASAATARAGDDVDALDAFARLLDRYVMEDGVRYDAWRDDAEDRAALRGVVASLAATDPGRLDRPDRFALYINLYNAATLDLVVGGGPVDSIRDLSRGAEPFEVFRRDWIEFDGATVSLDDLEKRLREESGDPRGHFAVNCASRSCPPLAREPFRGSKLDAQLGRQTRKFVASSEGLVVKEAEPDGARFEVSRLFDWYEEDFEPAGGVVAFLVRYAPGPKAKALRDAEAERSDLAFLEYDWSLNRAVEGTSP